jgi:hypothetical protein
MLPMGHSIPDDGFAHEKDMECPCQPYFHAIPRVGTAIVHRTVEDATCPDYVPEEWT